MGGFRHLVEREKPSVRAPSILLLLPSVALAAITIGCTPAKTTKSPPPADVSGHVTESDLVTIKLTAEAERRLGIELTPVTQRAVSQQRLVGGEVISAAAGASAATRYAATTTLTPAQLATAQIEADASVERARVALQAATARSDRIGRLFAAEAESARARDDALTEVRTAQATLTAARAQRSLLGQSIGSTAAPGRVWVRASVYGGDLARFDRRRAAQVSGLSPGSPSRSARPVQSATSSGASGASFLFYELGNADGAYRVGDKVSVAISTLAAKGALTVPTSAVLYDINGGEWVYERTAEHTFTRRRVEVSAIDGDNAVLSRGPADGAQVVHVGAPEIFGTEFGVNH